MSKADLLLFYDRPTEPCFMPKGEEKAHIDLPDEYFPERFNTSATILKEKFRKDCSRTVKIKNIPIAKLSLAPQLPYNAQFSLFVPKHSKMAGELIDTFMRARNIEEFISLASYYQLRINPYMFNYCLSVAILHRDDTKQLNIPTFVESFPDKFIDPRIIQRGREISSTVSEDKRMPIVIPQNYTASKYEPEQRVAYFREDIGINLHHWHWHLVYPFDADRALVNKNRRGELFYYMHQQIVARYNMERLCNKLSRVVPYNNFREPIEEGYFPKLDSQVSSRAWPPRFAWSIIRDLSRPVDEIQIDVSDLETWRDRFVKAVEENAIILPNGSKMALDEATGIDILGNLMESSIISRNRPYYGNLHNMGHVFISYCHDPDHANLEQSGVIGDSATAMRDPVFYRWHAFVDDIFQTYKSKLPVYSKEVLDFPGISVSSISVEGMRDPNTFSTMWKQSTVQLGRGLDFSPRGRVLASFTHLQHDEFAYKIEVNNTSGQGVTGTVRIFMAPTVDEQGVPLPFADQRKLMIELDKFSQQIPTGSSTITRKSTQSSVTIPFERVFRDQNQRPGGDPQGTQAAEFNFCGCGWPHHMLVPKGTTDGYPVVLFMMISNWEDDKVDQDTEGCCKDAVSYCGIRDRKYPDRRAMGFPFDRPASVPTVSEFLTPNMAIQECKIQFIESTSQP